MGYTHTIRLPAEQGAVISSREPGDTAFSVAMLSATAQLCHWSRPRLPGKLNSSVLQLRTFHLHKEAMDKKKAHAEGEES